MSRKKTVISVLAIILAFTLFMGVRLAVHSLRKGVTVKVEYRASEAELMTPGSGDSTKSELLPGEPVNINSASSQELQTLPGIGQSLAEEICDYRRTHGAFLSTEELKAVPGIGESLYEKIKDYICIEDTEP